VEIRTPEPETPVAPMARSEMPDAGINAANEPGSAGIKPNGHRQLGAGLGGEGWDG